MNPNIQNTIVALSTGLNHSAIALIRLSGTSSFYIAEKLTGEKWAKKKGYSLSYSKIFEKKQLIDEVLISTFKNPHSYTKEDSIEISCHASPYIVNKILSLCINYGARQALPGEFTQRAFLNGQMDLAQAEAVADVIASENEAMHRIAIQQLKGKVSDQIKTLRQQLIDFASLIELELDFGEEDVEFADRKKLETLIQEAIAIIKPLIESFNRGNAFKQGIPIAIVGKPNTGKSTLLNYLLNEERAIVSSIPGTTRDIIEDFLVLNGIKFRLIDTAGIRETTDEIENIGITKTHNAIEKASIILQLFDITQENTQSMVKEIENLNISTKQHLIPIINKIDQTTEKPKKPLPTTMFISSKTGEGITELKKQIIDLTGIDNQNSQQVIIANLRHQEHLVSTLEHLQNIQQHFSEKVTSDWIAIDIRQALHFLGAITGEVTTDEILGNIFGKFCIGK